MVSAPNSGGSTPGSSSGKVHCVVFLDKTLHSHGASLYPGVQLKKKMKPFDPSGS